MMKVRVSDKESRFNAVMDSSNSRTPSLLDKVRLTNGTDEYKKYFRNLVRYNKRKSIQMINDENLSFSSLMLLRPEVQRNNLYPYLNTRNRNALKIAETILSRESGICSRSVSNYKQMSYSDLRWIFDTGYVDDGISCEHDEVLDSAAILLVRIHGDKVILNNVLETIFTRYKNGRFIHDLVWAFFESRDPKCLIMAANKLHSNDPKDIELARKMLNFIPFIQRNRDADNQSQYTYALNWIQENYIFLYYTGESFNQSNSPIPYAVSPEGKYIFKPVSPETGKIQSPLTDIEQSLLNNFRSLDDKSKLLLSTYSFMLHRQNLNTWSSWLRYPVTEQLRIAESVMGGGLT
jgi:hypothetical protein